jgi:zinc protease
VSAALDGAKARSPRSHIIALLVTFLVSALISPAAAQVANWPVERPPQPLEARDVKFPPYEIRTLANGLQVVVVQHHEQPVVTLRMLIRAGAASDPEKKMGTAVLTAALLDQGTKTRSAEQIADAIDSIGGGLGTGAGTDLSYANVLVMKDSLDLGFELLNDVIRNPAFKPEELERQRQQAVSGLKVSYEDPDYVAGLVFDRLVYGFHPYGLPNSGTPESLQGVTVDDLRAFHDAYYAPNNALLAVVGDVAPEGAFAAAERVLGNWKPHDVKPAAPVSPPEPTRRVIVINKPDAVQTELRVGHLALPRKHPDYLAFDLAMKILGGEGANRLHRVLRSERGLTYGASAEYQALQQSGDFAADTNTRSDATAEVLRLIVEEITKLQRERVSDRELSDAQAYLAGNFPLTIETPDAIAAQVLNALFYGLPLSDIENYRELVNKITPDDIQRVARQYLRPDRLSVVLVGNATAFTKDLAGVGFPSYEQIDLPELDLTSSTLQRRARAALPRSGGR